MAVLRKNVTCPIFGHARELPMNTLPTYEDVMLCYLWINRNKSNQYKDLVSDTCAEVSEKVMEKWELASIPTIGNRAVVKKMKAYHEKYRNLLKPYSSRKDVKSYQDRMKRFLNDSKCLFDISACKCKCFDSCKCEKHLKVPVREREFLVDQRNERKMAIGNTDFKITNKLLKNISRKRKLEEYKEKASSSSTSEQPIPSTSDSLQPQTPSPQMLTPQISPHQSPKTPVPSEETLSSETSKVDDLSAIAKTLDRFGVSDRAGAAIVSATLQTVGIISEENLSEVVDRNKIRRAREKLRTTLTNAPLTSENQDFGLYFDGRKDKTLAMQDSRRRIIIEEHVSLLKEPGSEYLGHLSLNTGKAEIVSTKIKQFLDRKNIECSKLTVIGCDGTVVNTGSNGGVIRKLEVQLGKPLQWCVCQLHANELPLRHLFEKLDGSTTGPRSYIGPIGKALKACEDLPLVPFQAIRCTLPVITNIKDLSTDQLYLYEMCQAIDSGSCSESLSKKNPGKMVHSRWLTTANRILRLYVSSTEPNPKLLILTNFIIKVYAPMWFSIKTQPLCIFGARHLHKTIQQSRYLTDDLKAVVDPVIQRNGFFGHPENILIAMLADESETANSSVTKNTESATSHTFRNPQVHATIV